MEKIIHNLHFSLIISWVSKSGRVREGRWAEWVVNIENAHKTSGCKCERHTYTYTQGRIIVIIKERVKV
jgi:hypothetical protein